MLEKINPQVKELVAQCESGLQEIFARIDETALHVQDRVLEAFTRNHVSAMHMLPSTGYGYDDASRDTLDRVFAYALQCEDAIVRPQIASGTHALAVMLYAITKPGSRVLFAADEPYDTIHSVIGMGETVLPGSLKALGTDFKVTPLINGVIDFEQLEKDIVTYKPHVVYIQRSRGYAWREAINLAQIKRVADMAHEKDDSIIVAVDNCYGEFTCMDEPAKFGVDIMAGSLIKNPGGGIAPTGGYIAGRADLVELAAQRMTVPGMGREVGSYAAMYTPFYQGFFLAPHVVAQAKKIAVLIAAVFEQLGFRTQPAKDALRNDIVQSVRFDTAEQLIAFCKGVQLGAPIDSYATPEPGDMPGYDDPVIMAAGSFVQGASIEWSADGPVRAPYTAYIQGGLTYEHGKIAFMTALDYMCKEGLLNL